jgi:cytochrome P450
LTAKTGVKKPPKQGRFGAVRNGLIQSALRNSCTLRNWSRSTGISGHDRRNTQLGARAREVVIECLNRFYAKGQCEFMHEMALHVPVAIVMQVFDLPFSDRERLIPLVDVITHSEDLGERGRAIQGIMLYVSEWVAKRVQVPGDDAISILLKVKVGERPISNQEVVSTVTLLLLGGLDSVSHTMGAIMRFLAEHPDHQQQLVENPKLIPDAIDELLRRHAISITTRTLAQDTEVGGAQMKKGDRIMLPLPMTGIDNKAWENPMEVDFTRRPKDILNFGKGIHKCVGMNLARAELTALLEEWFKRIPAFSITPGDKVVTTSGQIQGVMHLPLSWSVA